MTGTYTEIVEIVAPASAVAGSTVNVEVRIKNTWSTNVHIYCVGVLDSQTRFIDWLDAWVSPGQTQSFYGSFTMLSQNVTINAYSYYEGVDGYLYFDDSKSKTVSVTEAVVGKISREELEYNSSRATIPASNIPKDKSGLVHIWGRNDTSTAQQMGIAWTLTDPDGVTRETYSTWEAWPYTGAGNEHEFIGGRFSLDKVGTWMINVQLYMNPSNPTIVDSYYGALCTVAAAVPEPGVSEFQIVDYVKV